MKKQKRFQYGDVVKFVPIEGKFAAKTGKALAQVVGYSPNVRQVNVLWIRNGDDKGQLDGNYLASDFVLLCRPRI